MNQATQERPAITMMPVASSQIAAIGHCPETNVLAIQFASRSGPGSVYHYQNFTAEDFAAFKDAESIGSHFGKFIKNVEKYPYEKIEAPAAVESRGKIIRVDGTEQSVDGKVSIIAIEKLIGADCIDTVNLRDGRVMLVDDQGVLKDLPVNAAATILYHGVCRPGTTHQIRGDVAVVLDADFA